MNRNSFSKKCIKFRIISSLFPKILWLVLFFFIFMSSALFIHAAQMRGNDMTSASKYFRNNPQNSTVIIFVHGVLGDPKSTWKNQNGAYWPDLLTKDKDFDGANIYVVKYPSTALEKTYNINEAAESMSRDLESDKVVNHSKLIFLAHSMGGLVTREFLLKYREYVENVSFLYFFATPTLGTNIVRIAKLLSNNPQYGSMLTMKSEDYLADIQRNWLDSEELTSIPSFGSYETKDTFGVRIVEQQSATSLCNRPVRPIEKNHYEIVKPASFEDESYRSFKAAYNRVSKTDTRKFYSSKKTVNELQEQMQGNPNKWLLDDNIKLRTELAERTSYRNVSAHPTEKIRPLAKFSHQEFLDNFVVFHIYNTYRRKLRPLDPVMLIELLNVYFRSVLLYPDIAQKKYYITASDGRLMLLQMQGHNERGETVSISLPEMSGTLLRDVSMDFAKNADLKQYDILESLLDCAYGTPELDKVHKQNILDAKYFIQRNKLSLQK